MSREYPIKNDIDLNPFIFQLYDIKNVIEEMMEEYGNYSEGREMYGADQDTLKSFKYMLKSFKDYYKHLKEEASSQEEIQLLEQTAREMLEM